MALDEEQLQQITDIMEKVMDQRDTQAKDRESALRDSIIGELNGKLTSIGNTLQSVVDRVSQAPASPAGADQGGVDGADGGMGGQLIMGLLMKVLGLGADAEPKDPLAGITKMAELHTMTRQVFMEPMRDYYREGARMMADAISVAVKSGQDVDLTKLGDVMDAADSRQGSKVDLDGEAKRLAAL